MADVGGLTLLYEDGWVRVFDKPSGVPVHKGLSRADDTVAARLAALGVEVPHFVHRLDAGTSGALVVAKDREAARVLGAAFAEGRVEKSYLAWVRGVCPAHVTVDHPIPRDEGGARVPAVTDLERLSVLVAEGSPLRESRYSLVLARPRTGRFHQVRRHLKHVGCPLVGDANYGKSEHNRFFAERFGLRRLALHAVAIAFPGADGQTIRVAAPIPSDFRSAVLASEGASHEEILERLFLRGDLEDAGPVVERDPQ